MPTFTPPASAGAVPNVTEGTLADLRAEVRGVSRRLFRRVQRNDRGQVVLKISGTYQTYDDPDSNTIASASEVYLGGHTYQVTQAVADALTAAGYAVT